MSNKERIVSEIKRTAAENDGVALGQERFEETTGIPISAWRGKYWRTWSEALVEAGFAPNRPKEAHQKETLLVCLLNLAREHGRFPTYADLRMAKQADPSFPTHHAFNNLGSRPARIQLIRDYVIQHPEHKDVLELFALTDGDSAGEGAESADQGDGSVYMLKLGKHYKIGKTFSVPRRHREISLELPEKPDVIHVITTDDPSGIESYWHTRFAAKRTNGEWFALTREDIRVFKRRKFM